MMSHKDLNIVDIDHTVIVHTHTHTLSHTHTQTHRERERERVDIHCAVWSYQRWGCSCSFPSVSSALQVLAVMHHWTETSPDGRGSLPVLRAQHISAIYDRHRLSLISQQRVLTTTNINDNRRHYNVFTGSITSATNTHTAPMLVSLTFNNKPDQTAPWTSRWNRAA